MSFLLSFSYNLLLQKEGVWGGVCVGVFLGVCFQKTVFLTLNCIRYSDLPLVHNETLLKKTTFPMEFYNYFYTMYTYTNHIQIPAKKNEKKFGRF